MRVPAIITAIAAVSVMSAACSETSGPATAVTLKLVSVDGTDLPKQLRTPGGRLVTVSTGYLQGTNWGHACGFALGLAEGPLSAVDVPDCRLHRDERRTFTLTFTDSRFPAGPHDYSFVP